VDVTNKKDEQSARELSDREKVLALALDAVTRDRNLDYGEPENNFADIAALWNVYLQIDAEGRPISPTDVAVLMILMKVSRIRTSPLKEDHWIDIAGYAACGYQTARAWTAYKQREE
jgi:hypothetical protein